jgi:hypothetical protein
MRVDEIDDIVRVLAAEPSPEIRDAGQEGLLGPVVVDLIDSHHRVDQIALLIGSAGAGQNALAEAGDERPGGPARTRRFSGGATMKVAVIGAGAVGSSIAREVVAGGGHHDLGLVQPGIGQHAQVAGIAHAPAGAGTPEIRDAGQEGLLGPVDSAEARR